MDRRTFLRTAGVVAGALGSTGLLAACGDGSGDAAGGATARGTGGGSGIPDGEPTLSLVNASFETLVGEERRVNLVLLENDATPVEGAEMSVFVRSLEGQVASGPHPATWYPESGPGTGTGSGLYQVLLPLTTAGSLEYVGVVGDRFGTAAATVVDPSSAQAPAPGETAVVTATPTELEQLGFERICTQDPPCPMHEQSLETVLAEGRPTMLLFATPAYCVTVACGPSVGNLQSVMESREWGDVAFVHCEIYTDQASAGSQVAPPVADWELPTEPWLFAIGPDGTIVDRLDGPMLAEDMARLAEQLTA